MNRPLARCTAAIIGVAAAAYAISRSPLMPDKKQRVIWDINSELNNLNSSTEIDHGREERALEARERAFG
jgi:hypothetical protein